MWCRKDVGAGVIESSLTPPRDEAGRHRVGRPGNGRRRGRLGLLVATTAMVTIAACSSAGDGVTPSTNATSTEPTAAATGATATTPATPAGYLDPSMPVEVRVDDLLARMTLDEKIGQMTLLEKGSITPALVERFHVGAILSGGGGAPSDNSVEGWREMVGAFQEASLATRLGVPILYGVDAVHGHNNLLGATIFPHNVGLGATRNPELVEAVGRATAVEVAATGIRWNYSPVVAVARDIRWGRTYEAFGENTELVTELGVAMIRGLQGDDLTAGDAVLATPKHFVGDGGTAWDTSIPYRIDQGITTADEAELRAVHLAPYPAAFDAGAISVMASYSSWENGKVHGDRYLLTDVLRGELGFEGFVVSDWAAVDQVVPDDYYASVVQSVNAGIDLVMVPSAVEEFQSALRAAIEHGDVSLERIDEAVRRILDAKVRMGLFEEPMPGADLVGTVGSPEHRELARRAVAASVVLLETTPGLLPLAPQAGPVLVGGSSADDIGRQSGGWTIAWQGGLGDITDGTSVLEALEDAAIGEIVHDPRSRFEEIGDQTAALGIAVIGEGPYAEGRGDSSTVSLPATETRVVETMRPLVDRLVVVVITGRPLVLGDVLDSADAVLVAWLPGTEGAGVVDVLTGEAPFNGRLPYTWPSSVDALGTPRADPCDGARYPYGYGLDAGGSLLAGASACEEQTP